MSWILDNVVDISTLTSNLKTLERISLFGDGSHSHLATPLGTGGVLALVFYVAHFVGYKKIAFPIWFQSLNVTSSYCLCVIN